MSRQIDSDALVRVNATLGIAGGNARAATILDDLSVSQVLQINDIVRRSRTPGGTGWFTCTLMNVHAAGGVEANAINPYLPGALVAGVGAWPQRVTPSFDVWLMDASLIETGAGGGLDAAALYIDPTANQQGWGRDQAGAAVISSRPQPVALWTSLNSAMAAIDPIGVLSEGGCMAKIGTRIGRGADIRFLSDAGAAATFRCMMTFGLFPEALGQDVAS